MLIDLSNRSVGYAIELANRSQRSYVLERNYLGGINLRPGRLVGGDDPRPVLGVANPSAPVDEVISDYRVTTTNKKEHRLRFELCKKVLFP